MGSPLEAAIREMLIRQPAHVDDYEHTLDDLLDALTAGDMSVEEVVVVILRSTGVKVSVPTIRSWKRKRVSL